MKKRKQRNLIIWLILAVVVVVGGIFSFAHSQKTKGPNRYRGGDDSNQRGTKDLGTSCQDREG